MTICSLILHARPENLDRVTEDLERMEGVEVHGRSDAGKLIVVIDHPERRYCSEAMMTMAKMDRVVNASLVYEYHEPDGASFSPEDEKNSNVNRSISTLSQAKDLIPNSTINSTPKGGVQ